MPIDIKDTTARIEVVIGSVRKERFGHNVGVWAAKHLADNGADASIDVDVIDLAELNFPRDMATHLDVGEFADRIAHAAAVVIITPEYNHSFPGPLKSAIDSIRDEWRAKPIGFVCYGGIAGGLRAVEALRLVFAELNAISVRETVSLHNPWQKFEDPEQDYPGTEAVEALIRMRRQLMWWAEATRAMSARQPLPTH